MASWPRLTALACALLLAVLAVPTAVPTSAAASGAERAVLAEVNRYRAAHGVSPVRYSRTLSRSAGRHSTHILRVNRPHHDHHISVRGRYRLLGENIAWLRGKRRSAARVVRMWAGSASHRGVMLNPRFSRGGVGRKYGRLGRRAATVWTLHLGRK